jgi:hypothetical protein
MRSVGLIGLLAGLTGALLYLAGAGGAPVAPILVGLAPFPFFVAALGWGNLAGLAAGASALAIVAAVTGIAPGLGLAWAFSRALTFALTAIAPALWLSHLALLRRHLDAGNPNSQLEWYPLGHLALWLAGLACAGYLALEALAHAVAGQGLAALIAQYLDANVPAEMRGELLTRTGAPSWPVLLDLLSRMLPAMGGVFWQIWIVANGLGAYSLLAATGRCPRPEAGWLSFSLPRAFAGPFFLSLALAMSGVALRSVALTLTSLLFIPYFFLGLAVVHAIPVKGPGRIALLGLFYFLLLFQAWPVIPTGILGLMEQWFGLRARVPRRPGREDK